MKRNLSCWAIALCIFVFGVFCICLPVSIWKGTISIDSVLKILGMVISWPLAILVISLNFFTRFQTSLDYFLMNIRSFQFPGGNIQTQAGASPDAAAPALLEHIAHRDAAASQKALSRDLNRDLNTAITHAFQWKFRYLSIFFVQSTKQILLWFAQSPPQPRESYNQHWQMTIPDANQRGIILDVLMQYHMLCMDGATIRITKEGYGFLQFIGMIR